MSVAELWLKADVDEGARKGRAEFSNDNNDGLG